MICEGTTSAGLPCRAAAQPGHRSCPAHRYAVEGTEREIRHCGASTRAGDICRAGAEAGYVTCAQHRSQEPR